MSDLLLVLSVAIVTYASRVVFLVRPRPIPAGPVSRFLEVFPLALFLAIATSGLRGDGGAGDVVPGLAAAVGGIAGAILFRRSLLGVLAVGAGCFYLVRLFV